MKVSLNLINKFVKVNVTPEKLANLLTLHAFEVESIHSTKPKFSGVFTAKVIKIEKHPNADRLRVITLGLGNKNVSPVVCGAWNFEVGDTVALALPGAFIPKSVHDPEAEGSKLETAIIRGVESQGMICAAFELGLTFEIGEGILVLDEKIKIGLDFARMQPNDTVLDLALPANRPDLFSHLGIAREIAAILNKKVSEPKLALGNWSKGARKANLVKIPKLVPKFFTVEMSDLVVKESPDFIINTLKSLGMKPINNVVDITNYVMLEVGAPIHAFDSEKLKGQIIVRAAKEKEKVTVINHKTYELASGMMVLADNEKALDIGGVMGGLETEVHEKSTNIVLTAGNFDKTAVRKASRYLGLATEGSRFWEKGLHPNLINLGLNRAVELLRKYAKAKTGKVIYFDVYKSKQNIVSFSANNVNDLLGTDIKSAQIKSYIARYGIKVAGSGKMKAYPPYWRAEVSTPEDLAEEVLKLFGTNSVVRQPIELFGSKVEVNETWELLRKTKDLWVNLGFWEMQNYSFVSAQEIAMLEEDISRHIKITNPLSHEQGYMRRGGLVSLIKNAFTNQNLTETLKIFEIGKRYLGYDNEPWILTALMMSKAHSKQIIFRQAKGSVEAYLEKLGVKNIYWKAGKADATLFYGDLEMGKVSLVNAKITNSFNLTSRPIFIKLELQEILKLVQDLHFERFSRLPSVSRDISVIVSKDKKWTDLDGKIRPILNSLEEVIASYRVFDIALESLDKDTKKYALEIEKQGKRNLLISFDFKPKKETLTEVKISSILNQILLKLKQDFKAEIR